MARAKKGLRKINVDGIVYGYKIKYDDSYYIGVDVSIGLLDNNQGLLMAFFDTCNERNRVPNFRNDGSFYNWFNYQKVIVTPKIIRQIIKLGLAQNWNPQSGKSLRLGSLNDQIEGLFLPEIAFPTIKENEVVLNFTKKIDEDHHTPVKINLETFHGRDGLYKVFETLEKARTFALNTLSSNSSADIRAWIKTAETTVIYYADSKGETHLEG